ncbi:Glycogen debranching enzyme [Pantoea agglomerans]|uniref:Glycogen debranching enzyme n=1 Tax=Enterobacter agglomerans TaxID=549 RepID=A0A379AAJ7_ENTAG|nr:Glycogen debranching enzyme [Pantoea agglomerans]
MWCSTHTAELDEIGPTISMRGIDNASYYWLDEQGDYQNWTGCGNTLNIHHPSGDDVGFRGAALLGAGLPRRRLPL